MAKKKKAKTDYKAPKKKQKREISESPSLVYFLTQNNVTACPAAVSRYLRIGRATLYKHEREGKITPARRDSKGKRFYTKEDFLELYRYFYPKSADSIGLEKITDPSAQH